MASNIVARGGLGRVRRTLAAVGLSIAAVTASTMTLASPALANADVCSSNVPKDARTCMTIKGTGRQVDQIATRFSVWGRKGDCWTGHVQVLIGGDHYANGAEKSFCETNVWSQSWALGTWNNIGRLPAGVRVCARFWAYVDGSYHNYYGSACAVIG